jgi:GNAT superfamily N-acetyltransferase
LTPADLAFAWALYRESMKPLTEEFMTWDDAPQMRVVERDAVSGEASVIMRGRTAIGWLRACETAAEIELLQLYVAPDARDRGVGTAILRGLMALPVSWS